MDRNSEREWLLASGISLSRSHPSLIKSGVEWNPAPSLSTTDDDQSMIRPASPRGEGFISSPSKVRPASHSTHSMSEMAQGTWRVPSIHTHSHTCTSRQCLADTGWVGVGPHTCAHGETRWNQLKVSHQGGTDDTHTYTYNSICCPYIWAAPSDLTKSFRN